jgi:hypothetical protein
VTGRLFTDTSNFLSIDRGDEILIDGKRYKVTGHEHESRFGMTDPNVWGKKAVDPDTGEKKIIKLAFLESFETSLAGIKVHCFRDPEKEARVLETVRNHSHFMQGKAYRDAKGNSIRLLDVVRGPNFFVYIRSLEMDHESYFHTVLPAILQRLVKLFEAVRFLHVHGYRHGDIRNDHVIMENDTGRFVWIDFDYDFETPENPFSMDIFGMGNIVLYAVGKGYHDMHGISTDIPVYGDLKDRVVPDDFSILNRWRLTNLRKLYPYVPAILNDILLHFSRGADVFYETADEIIEDLNRCLHLVFSS